MLLSFFQQKGIDIELEKEFFYNNMLSYAAMDNSKAFEEMKQKAMQLIYPDQKNQIERLKEEANQLFEKNSKKSKHRMRAVSNKAITSEDPLAEFKNRKM